MSEILWPTESKKETGSLMWLRFFDRSVRDVFRKIQQAYSNTSLGRRVARGWSPIPLPQTSHTRKEMLPDHHFVDHRMKSYRIEQEERLVQSSMSRKRCPRFLLLYLAKIVIIKLPFRSYRQMENSFRKMSRYKKARSAVAQPHPIFIKISPGLLESSSETIGLLLNNSSLTLSENSNLMPERILPEGDSVPW